jgi:hypothetical protein
MTFLGHKYGGSDWRLLKEGLEQKVLSDRIQANVIKLLMQRKRCIFLELRLELHFLQK